MQKMACMSIPQAYNLPVAAYVSRFFTLGVVISGRVDNMNNDSHRRWHFAAVLVIMAVVLFFVDNRVISQAPAAAQSSRVTTDNIVVVPVQVGRDSYGVAMVDKAGKTLWVYEFNSRGQAHNRMRLLAARSWEYDRLLRDYNSAEPKPEQVRDILRKLGPHRETATNPEPGTEETENMAQPERN